MRLPSADAPLNWLLTAPLPPLGPVDTISVVLWLPQAAAGEAARTRPAARLLPPQLHPQSGESGAAFPLNFQSGNP